MKTGTDRTVAVLAARQHGVVSRNQLILLGLRPGGITWRVRERRLETVYPGVYRAAGSPDTHQSRLMAACLAAGPHAAISHASAGGLWGLDGIVADRIELTTFGVRPPRLVDVRAHRSDDGDRQDRVRLDCIPVTSVARTLVDLAGVLAHIRLERALDDALTRRLTTLSRLRDCLDRRANVRGRATLRALLDRRDPAADRVESPLEHRVLRTLVAAGIPRPVLQHPVRVGGERFVLDLAWPDARVGVEVDGWAWHGSRRMFDRDRHKSNVLQQAGWLLLRFTSSMPPAVMVDQVCQGLARTRSVSL